MQLHIDDSQSNAKPIDYLTVGTNTADTTSFGPTVQVEDDDKGSYKVSVAKVLTALAIVGSTGYLAYWVQEPAQIQGDVINAEASTELPADSEISTTSTEASSELVADSEMTETTPVDALSEAITAAQTEKVINVSQFGFDPAVLEIEKGMKVKWVNSSIIEQNIIGSLTNGESFTSGPLNQDEIYEFTFEDTTDVEYYSTANPALKGTIKVTEAKEVATAIETTTAPLIEAPEITSDVAVETTSTTTLEDLKPAAEVATPATMTDEEIAKETLAEIADKGAAEENKEITKTGPENLIYVAALVLAAYLNRKQLAALWK